MCWQVRKRSVVVEKKSLELVLDARVGEGNTLGWGQDTIGCFSKVAIVEKRVGDLLSKIDVFNGVFFEQTFSVVLLLVLLVKLLLLLEVLSSSVLS